MKFLQARKARKAQAALEASNAARSNRGCGVFPTPEQDTPEEFAAVVAWTRNVGGSVRRCLGQSWGESLAGSYHEQVAAYQGVLRTLGNTETLRHEFFTLAEGLVEVLAEAEAIDGLVETYNKVLDVLLDEGYSEGALWKVGATQEPTRYIHHRQHGDQDDMSETEREFRARVRSMKAAKVPAELVEKAEPARVLLARMQELADSITAASSAARALVECRQNEVSEKRRAAQAAELEVSLIQARVGSLTSSSARLTATLELAAASPR